MVVEVGDEGTREVHGLHPPVVLIFPWCGMR